jgi:TRAP-type C4-dicarboxylate transport system permease small subunit
MLIPKAHAFTVKSYIGDGTLGINSLEDLLLALLNVLIVIAIPIVVLFIIYAGFMYVTARGNAEQTQQATRTLTYAIVGGVMIIGAVAISEILANVVDSFTV